MWREVGIVVAGREREYPYRLKQGVVGMVEGSL